MRLAIGILCAALGGTAATACGHDATGPAWPKPHVSADSEDGGESLAPKPSAQAIAEAAGDAAPSDDAPAAEAAAPAAVTPTAPAAQPTQSVPTEDPATTDEIVIEVNGDE